MCHLAVSCRSPIDVSFLPCLVGSPIDASFLPCLVGSPVDVSFDRALYEALLMCRFTVSCRKPY